MWPSYLCCARKPASRRRNKTAASRFVLLSVPSKKSSLKHAEKNREGSSKNLPFGSTGEINLSGFPPDEFIEEERELFT